MNKLIEFLHDPESKCLILGNNGFQAKRYSHAVVVIWYEGKKLCRLFREGLQWTVDITPLLNRAECKRMTELFALLGMPQLRMRVSARGACIRREPNIFGMPEYLLPLEQPLKVTV